MRLKKVSLLLFFTSLLQLSIAQTLVEFDAKESFREEYAVSKQTSTNYINTNYILIEIAKGLQKNPSFVKLYLEGNLRLQLINSSEDSYLANADFGNIRLGGEIKYRGFDITEVLLPDLYLLSLRAKNLRNGQQWFHTIGLTPINLHDGHARLGQFELSDTMRTAHELRIDTLSFSHSSEAVKAFDSRINCIDSYYLSEIQIQSALQKTLSIQADNVDMIPLYDFQLKEAEQIVKTLESKNYSQLLSLHENDPIQFQLRLNELRSRTEETRNTLNNLLSTLDQVYFQKGLEYVQKGNDSIAEGYFKKSLLINPYFTPAHYQLGKLYFNQEELQKSADLVNKVLTEMKPDNATLNALFELGASIQQQYITKAEELMIKEQYPEAIELLKRGIVFCSSSPGLICSDQIQRSLARAKYGMYNSYLTIARRALEKANTDLAENYTHEAWKYQQQNTSEIISATEAFQLFNSIAASLMKNGQENLSQKRFSAALKDFSSAERICAISPLIPRPEMLNLLTNKAQKGVYDNMVIKAYESYKQENISEAETRVNDAIAYRSDKTEAIPSTLGTDTLMARIRSQSYKEYIYRGEQYLGFNDHKTALLWLSKAQALELQLPMSPDKNLPELLKKAAKPVILQNISEANIKIWGNMLEQASSLTCKIIEDQQNFGLQEDAEINEKLKEIKGKIFSKDCLNLQKEYDEQLQLARQNINAYDYITGNACYTKASVMADSKPDCKINTSFALEMIERYKPASDFQKMQGTLERALAEKRFEEMPAIYKELSDYYSAQNISRFALKMPVLFNLVYPSGHDALVWFTNYYSQSADTEKAFSLLKKLKDTNFPLALSRPLQEQAAIIMAQKDLQLYPTRNPKDQVLIYTLNDKWFKYFRKVYLKTWKLGR